MWILTHKQQKITKKKFVPLKSFKREQDILALVKTVTQAKAFRCAVKPTALAVPRDNVILPPRWRSLPMQTDRGVVLPEARAACSALWKMLAVTESRSSSGHQRQHLVNGCARGKVDKLALWLTAQQTAEIKTWKREGGRRGLGHARPSWMLFHPVCGYYRINYLTLMIQFQNASLQDLEFK